MASLWFTLFGSKTLAALAHATQAGNVEKVRSILPYIDGNALSAGDLKTAERDPLHIAARMGNLPIVRMLLEHCHAGQPAFARREPALVAAAENGHETVVAELLRHGSLEVPLRCMYQVAKDGNLTLARLIVSGCAHLNGRLCISKMTPDEDRDHVDTVIGVAARNGHRDIVALLLAHGVSPNATSEAAYTMRHGPLDSAATRADVEMMRTLLRCGADVNGAGETCPLHCAARQGNIAAMRLLLSAGADVQRRQGERYGRNTSLHEAVGSGQLEAARLLLECGAEVNATAGTDDDTPLHLCAASNRLDLIQLLLQYSANPNAGKRRRPLDLAAISGSIAAMKALLNAGAEPSASLDHAACAKDSAIIRLLLDAGADIQRGHPLHHAVRTMNVSSVRLLLDRGADVHLPFQEQTWMAPSTPLQYVLRQQDEEGRWASRSQGPPSEKSLKLEQVLQILREHTDRRLSPHAKQIREHIDSKRIFGVLRAPNIPDAMMRKTAELCSVAQSADILAVVDLSVVSPVNAAFAVCIEGIRYRGHNRKPAFISYEELVDLPIAVSRSHVQLGPVHWFSQLGSGRTSNEQIGQLLTDIQFILRANHRKSE
jgi:ankyrin repeat protein